MKHKLLGLATATMIFAGGAMYAFSSNEAECELKGTPACPLVDNCPLKGTPDCPLVDKRVKVVKTANVTRSEDLPDCCKKK